MRYGLPYISSHVLYVICTFSCPMSTDLLVYPLFQIFRVLDEGKRCVFCRLHAEDKGISTAYAKIIRHAALWRTLWRTAKAAIGHIFMCVHRYLPSAICQQKFGERYTCKNSVRTLFHYSMVNCVGVYIKICSIICAMMVQKCCRILCNKSSDRASHLLPSRSAPKLHHHHVKQ